MSIAVHGALVATLAFSLRPWAAPSDAQEGREFLAQFSSPAPEVEPEPTEVPEAIAPTPSSEEVPEEPLVLPEVPALPIEAHPPRSTAPITSNLLESVVFPRVGRRQESRPKTDAEGHRPSVPAETPALEEPELEPPGIQSAPSSPEPLEGLCVPPAYPDMAARRGWTGTVILLIEVSSDGAVARATVESSSGHAILDLAARRAVEEWRFTPAILAGVPAPATVRKPIRFGDA
ncbi:MAG: energy transducer TonB [Planctomycetota bacterium]|nr:energy transducer TonB [Planctomycetota bacterium]